LNKSSTGAYGVINVVHNVYGGMACRITNPFLRYHELPRSKFIRIQAVIIDQHSINAFSCLFLFSSKSLMLTVWRNGMKSRISRLTHILLPNNGQDLDSKPAHDARRGTGDAPTIKCCNVNRKSLLTLAQNETLPAY